MKFLIPNWYSHNLDEITAVLQQKKHSIVSYHEKPRNYNYDPVFRKNFKHIITEQKIDVVFSLQYFPIISNICEKLKIPYISWSYNDQINSLLFTNSIYNTCNVIFHTDSQWTDKLQRLSIKNVYYLPWAFSSKHMPEKTSDSKSTKPRIDISLFDTTDVESQLSYRKLCSRLDDRTKGFLNGLMQAQQGIYGYNFVQNVLYDTVLSTLQTAFPPSIPKDNIAPIDELYAFQIIYPAITKKEVDNLLNKLEQEKEWNTIFYTPFPNNNLKHITQESLPAKNKDYFAIYTNSKINLLTAPREIQNGIPIQAMDIMGCGGFLITNFQNDYLRFFDPDRDYVYYESPDDMRDKVQYYLQHEKERHEIAMHALKNIIQKHTFELRINEIFAALNLN